ncbi:MAG: hypothetical protein EP322_00135 [Bacteroidetes bacterium]|nr:MAG: hypothetical protein EP322_00135 [Bacteroidota bacterium]
MSGILTIALAFTGSFEDKARLNVYVESQDYFNEALLEGEDEKSYFPPTGVSVVKIINSGELPAKDVHVNFRKGFKYAAYKDGDKYLRFDSGDSIYIDKLEPDQSVSVHFWHSFVYFGSSNVDEALSVSSKDSGKATVRTDITGTGVIWYIEEYFILFVMVPVAIFFILLLYYADLVEKLQRKIKAADNSKNTEVKLKELSHAWSVGVLSEEEYQEEAKRIVELSSIKER